MQKLLKSFLQYSENGMSVSILRWTPDAEDEGKYLTCRAENRHLPETAIEDKWKLKVHCKYEVFGEKNVSI